MKKSDGRIEQIINYLASDRHPSDVLEEKAKEFGVTTSYLKQLFKKNTGTTILQYDRDLRLYKAKYLLETTYKQVKEIYLEVGFKHYENFLKDFKKKFGKTAKEVQKESWIKRADGENEK